MINMQYVDSSNINAVGFDEEAEAMLVEFNSGDTYQYEQVPEQVFRDLMDAKSIGSFFHTHVRGVYDFAKV